MISYTEISTGFAVKFPKILKDSFKSVFKTAKWNWDACRWEVGPRSKKKLDQWISEAAKIQDDIEELEAEEMDFDTVRSLKFEIESIKSELQAQLQRLSRLKGSQEEIKSLRSELSCIKSELDLAKNECLSTKKISAGILSEFLDFDEIRKHFSIMQGLQGRMTTSNRERFEESQRFFVRTQKVLQRNLISSKGIDIICDVNWNRPDRDKLLDKHFDDIYTISKIEGNHE